MGGDSDQHFLKRGDFIKKVEDPWSKVIMSDKSDAIRVLHKSGKTASEIFKILKPTVSRSGVYYSAGKKNLYIIGQKKLYMKNPFQSLTYCYRQKPYVTKALIPTS